MLDCGKRQASRLRVKLPAKAVLLNGQRRASLCDLSQSGARIGHPDLPILNGEILLEWCGFEAFGWVVWSKPGLSGISFYDPIPKDWVLATRNLDSAGEVPGEAHITREHARAWVEGHSRI
ncbi:PilZ domain-containing protein [Novosphingobium sp.]|uniref:PilZ domain-containing protein n=1 Tax=Novosphingobium sp. TaxID=1874826 RepID=UPI0035B349C9